jgi:hypothetical protein
MVGLPSWVNGKEDLGLTPSPPPPPSLYTSFHMYRFETSAGNESGTKPGMEEPLTFEDMHLALLRECAGMAYAHKYEVCVKINVLLVRCFPQAAKT